MAMVPQIRDRCTPKSPPGRANRRLSRQNPFLGSLPLFCVPDLCLCKFIRRSDSACPVRADRDQKHMDCRRRKSVLCPCDRSLCVFASSVLLHLPLSEEIPPAQEFLPLGLRAFTLYVQAHHLYLKEDYGKSVGIVEGHPGYRGGWVPYPCHLPAFSCGHGLYELKTDTAGTEVSAGCMGNCQPRWPD